LRYSGTGRVTVRVPLIGDKERVYVFDAEDAFICTATPAPTFQFGDPEGAKEQRRQDKEFRRQMAEYGQVPRDNRAAMRAVVDMMPEPQAPSSGRISINEEFREAARSAASVPKQVSAPSRQQQLQDKALKRLTGDWRKRAAGE
jgi:hypothetical protein